MEITRVDVHKVNGNDPKLKGFASITIDDCFRVNNIRIIEGKDRMFCAMPSRKVNDERFEDIVHPTNTETRELIEAEILKKYNSQTEE